jgi:hypothetical protein
LPHPRHFPSLPPSQPPLDGIGAAGLDAGILGAIIGSSVTACLVIVWIVMKSGGTTKPRAPHEKREGTRVRVGVYATATASPVKVMAEQPAPDAATITRRRRRHGQEEAVPERPSDGQATTRRRRRQRPTEGDQASDGDDDDAGGPTASSTVISASEQATRRRRQRAAAIAASMSAPPGDGGAEGAGGQTLHTQFDHLQSTLGSCFEASTVLTREAEGPEDVEIRVKMREIEATLLRCNSEMQALQSQLRSRRQQAPGGSSELSHSHESRMPPSSRLESFRAQRSGAASSGGAVAPSASVRTAPQLACGGVCDVPPPERIPPHRHHEMGPVSFDRPEPHRAAPRRRVAAAERAYQSRDTERAERRAARRAAAAAEVASSSSAPDVGYENPYPSGFGV